MLLCESRVKKRKKNWIALVDGTGLALPEFVVDG